MTPCSSIVLDTLYIFVFSEWIFYSQKPFRHKSSSKTFHFSEFSQDEVSPSGKWEEIVIKSCGRVLIVENNLSTSKYSLCKSVMRFCCSLPRYPRCRARARSPRTRVARARSDTSRPDTRAARVLTTRLVTDIMSTVYKGDSCSSWQRKSRY